MTWLVSNRLDLFIGVTASYGLGLIYPSTIAQDSLLFAVIIGLVIQRQIAAVITSIIAHNGSAITYIHYVYAFFNE